MVMTGEGENESKTLKKDTVAEVLFQQFLTADHKLITMQMKSLYKRYFKCFLTSCPISTTFNCMA
jgi:hypothetical protein